MCGEAKSTNKSSSLGSKYSTLERKSWAQKHGVGFYGNPSKPTSDTNNPHAKSAQRDSAFGEGVSPASLGGGDPTGNGGGQGKQTLGAPEQTTTPIAGSITQRVPAPRMTSVYGVMGKQTMEETEEAFVGSSGPFGKRGNISVPNSFGWDFKKGKPTGKSPAWNASVTESALRDMVAEAMGSPYDRTVTPSRAKTMLSKGKGVLSTWTEGLQEGNYQYDENGKPAFDKLGMLAEMTKPVGNVVRGDILGALFNGVDTVETLMDHHKLKNAGVFGKTPAAPKGNTKDHILAGDGEERNRLFPTLHPSTPTVKTESVSARARPKKVRRGRDTLLLTGSSGVEDKANIFLTGLKKG